MCTREQWIALEESYLTNVRVEIMDLRDQFYHLQKGYLSISQCMIKMKIIFDHIS